MAETAAKAPKAAKTLKEKRPRKIAGFPMEAKISFGVDKEGKPYSRSNCPKRAGSKAATQWALYRDGMTIDQALKAGLNSGDITWDKGKGYIMLAA